MASSERASDDDDGKIEQRGHVNVIRKNLGETFGVGNDWIYGRGDFGVSINQGRRRGIDDEI
jgi:hypothetical protein